jgi:glycosyltransferase involved in cell wall biosynthesis
VRIIAFAYSCEPNKGSEPGAGWILAQNLASFSETWVITRANNRSSIEGEIERVEDAHNLHFEYVDLPKWARFWKKGQRGVRLYYLFWQFAALKEARRLARSVQFDYAWHLTIANAWLGSAAALVGLPFIYGPVGGGVRPPIRLLPTLGIRGIAYEIVREVARQTSRYLNPLARLSWRRAKIILVQNHETAGWLPARHRRKAKVFQNAAVERDAVLTEPSRSQKTAVLTARLLPWKGASLAIRAIGRLHDWHLVICGKGPDEARLRRLAAKLGVGDRVEFRGHVPQEELLHLYASGTSVFLYPSLHDDSPLAVAEAVVAGLRVVCLDVGGPALIAGAAATLVDARGSGAKVTKRLAIATEKARSLPSPKIETRKSLQIGHKAKVLSDILSNIPE